MNSNFIINGENIIIDGWGGHKVYNINNKTLTIQRPYGLFSNINVTLYTLFLLEQSNYEVSEIILLLDEYETNKNYHPLLFDNIQNNLSFDDITSEDLNKFYKNTPGYVGLGLDINSINKNSLEEINIKIGNRLIKKYFNSSKIVNDTSKKLMEKYNLIDQEYVFLWARNTDRVFEVPTPTVEKYYNILESNGLINNKIVIQTDDLDILNGFKQTNLDFIVINEIPFSNNGSFHVGMRDISQNDFIQEFNITKDEYLILIMSLVDIASKSKKCIIYPGNLSTYIPMYKNSVDDCIVFTGDNGILI